MIKMLGRCLGGPSADERASTKQVPCYGSQRHCRTTRTLHVFDGCCLDLVLMTSESLAICSSSKGYWLVWRLRLHYQHGTAARRTPRRREHLHNSVTAVVLLRLILCHSHGLTLTGNGRHNAINRTEKGGGLFWFNHVSNHHVDAHSDRSTSSLNG